MSSQHLLLGFLQPMDMNCYVSLKWRLLSKDCITHCCAIRRGKTIFVVTLLRDICGQNGFKQNAKQSQQNDTLRTQSGVHKYVNEIKKNMANHRFYIQRHTYWYLNGKWSNVRTIEHTSRPHFEQQQQQQQQR